MADRDITEESGRSLYKACCDIYENDSKIFLELEMPGVSREDLDVKIVDDKLIIHGKKRQDSVKGSYLLKEIRNGDYYHEFTIDNTIDRNKIEATLKNGVATIVMGIRESEKPKKITISVK